MYAMQIISLDFVVPFSRTLDNCVTLTSRHWNMNRTPWFDLHTPAPDESCETYVCRARAGAVEKFFRRRETRTDVKFNLESDDTHYLSRYARKCYSRDRYICLECYDELASRRSDKYIIFN